MSAGCGKTLRRAVPDASIIRIRPGYAEGRRIWEVYYSREESDVKRHYYGFYAFEDGRLIRAYGCPRVHPVDLRGASAAPELAQAGAPCPVIAAPFDVPRMLYSITYGIAWEGGD